MPTWLCTKHRLTVSQDAWFVPRYTFCWRSWFSSVPNGKQKVRNQNGPRRARFGSVKCGSSITVPDATIRVIGWSNQLMAAGSIISQWPLGPTRRFVWPVCACFVWTDLTPHQSTHDGTSILRSETDRYRKLRSFPPSAGMQS